MIFLLSIFVFKDYIFASENNFLNEREDLVYENIDDGFIYFKDNESLGNFSLKINPLALNEEKENILNFKKISISDNNESSCLISKDNNLYCTGKILNFYKENTENKNYYKKIEGVKELIDVAVGKEGDFACVVTLQGNALCFGNGQEGKLANGSDEEKHVLTRVLNEDKDIFKNAKTVSLGKDHGCIVSNEQDLYCFGRNKEYQIGDREKDNYLYLKKSKYFNGNVKEVYLGDNHTCALLDNNSLSCFGSNDKEELQDGTKENNDVPNIIAHDVKQVSTRKNTICYIDSRLKLNCVGENKLHLDTNTLFVSVGKDEIFIHTPCFNEIRELKSNKIIYKETENKNTCCLSNDYYKIEDKESCDDEEIPESPCKEQGYYTCKGDKVVCKVNIDKSKKEKEVCNDGIDNNCDGEIDEGCDLKLTNILNSEVSNLDDKEEIELKDLKQSKLLKDNEKDGFNIRDITPTETPTPLYIGSATQVSSNGDHNCALTSSKNVYCWGNNLNGQLGDGTTETSFAPVKVKGGAQGGTYLENITQVSIGQKYSCALDESKNVYCWGNNEYRYLGRGTTSTAPSSVPIKVKKGQQDVTGDYLSNITKIYAGYRHICALDENKNVYCWGLNHVGQLGNTSSYSSSIPIKVKGLNCSGSLENIIEISAGHDYTCAVNSSGYLYCWGSNAYGKLGTGDYDNRSCPNIVSLNNITKVATGNSHTCALNTSKNVYCWGSGNNGRLGNGDEIESTTPVQVVPGAQSETESYLKDISDISISFHHTCAIDTDKNVYCWGYNGSGQLGLGYNSKRNFYFYNSKIPSKVLKGAQSGNGQYLENIKQVSAGPNHTCAVDSSNNIYCWGDNSHGILGNNSDNLSPKPVKVVKGEQVEQVGALTPTLTPVYTSTPDPTPIATYEYLQNITQISSGGNRFACAIDNNNGSKNAYCWGDNYIGQLGNNNDINSFIPVKVVRGEQGSGGLYFENAEQVASGTYHSCVIDGNKNIYCWGRNGGRLGNNRTGHIYKPVIVHEGEQGGTYTPTPNSTITATPIPTPFKNAIKIANGYYHSCAIDENQNVYCWGNGDHGQLGNGTLDNSSTPRKVLAGEQGGGEYLSNIVDISGTYAHTCALDSAGYVYCWGSNAAGRLGSGNTTDSTTPVKVVGVGKVGYLSNITQISVAYRYSCALDEDGYVYCWGAGYDGELGNNTFSTSGNAPIRVHEGEQGGALTPTPNYTTTYTPNYTLTPTPAPTYLKNITQIEAGDAHMCALDTSENVYCWGSNSVGKVGNNSSNDASTPRKVVGGEQGGTFLSNITSITSKGIGGNTCAIDENKNVYCWGRNRVGHLGNGSDKNSHVPVKVRNWQTPTPTNTNTPTNTYTPTKTPTRTPSRTKTPTKTISPTPTVSPTGTRTPTVRPTKTRTPTRTISPTMTKTPTVTPTVIPTLPYAGVVSQISAGYDHTCAVLDYDGETDEVYCWGNNSNGQLGNNTKIDSIYPVKVTFSGGNVFRKKILKISAGYKTTCVSLDDTSSAMQLYCWGKEILAGIDVKYARNFYQNDFMAGKTIRDISVSKEADSSGRASICLVTKNGKLYCWGGNANNQIGTAISPISSPTLVSDAYDFIKVSVSDDHMCAITSDYYVYCMGDNTSGQLGNATNISSSSFVQVVGHTGTGNMHARGISTGNGWSCVLNGIKTYCFGTNSQINLSSNYPSYQLSMQTYNLVNNEFLGHDFLCQIGGVSNRPIKCEGEGTNGQLGDGNNTSSTTLVDTGLRTDSDSGFDIYSNILSTGYRHACFVSDKGEAYCWGDNSSSQVGDQTTTNTTAPIKIYAGSMYTLTPTVAPTETNTPTDTITPTITPTATITPTFNTSLPYEGVVSQVSAGFDHTCVVQNSDAVGNIVECWGNNDNGQLGNNTYIDSATPVYTGVDSNIYKISAGYKTTCAISSYGCPGGTGLRCWGKGFGYNATLVISDENPIDFIGYPVSDVSVSKNDGGFGYPSICAIAHGKLYCMGGNSDNQIGTLSNPTTSMTLVSDEYVFKQVSVGVDHTCAITDDNKVYCMGNNTLGQLGNKTNTSSSSLVQVVGTGGTGEFTGKGISVGNGWTCVGNTALNTYCFGYNAITNLNTNYPNSSLGGGTLTAILFNSEYVGYNHVCQLFTSTGSYPHNVQCKGEGTSGQLGNGNNVSSSSLVSTGLSSSRDGFNYSNVLSSGYHHTCFVSDYGELYCWGGNDKKQVGNQTTTDALSPVKIYAGSTYTLTPTPSPTRTPTRTETPTPSATEAITKTNTPTQTRTPSNTPTSGAVSTETPTATPTINPSACSLSLKQIETGNMYTCAIMVDGSVACWGRNNYGQLGDGTLDTSLIPRRVLGGEQGNTLLQGITQIASGEFTSCAIDESKNVYCWGSNDHGQLGNNTTIDSSTPVKVLGGAQGGSYLGNIKQVNLGRSHACALDTSGNVYCWGYNWQRKLGNNSDVDSSIPVKVIGGAQGGTYLENITSIATKYDHVCALDTSKSVYCWGMIAGGHYTPYKVTGVDGVGYLSNIIKITAGSHFSCVIDESSNVYCWGWNVHGQLGNGLIGKDYNSNDPVQVKSENGLSYLSNIKDIELGQGFACAINNSNEMYCWGYNITGQLGLGDTDDKSLPTHVTNGGQSLYVSKVSGNYYHTCINELNGDFYCWGRNYYGRLGDRTTDERHSIDKTKPVNLTDFCSTPTPTPTADFGNIPYPGVIMQSDEGNAHTCALMGEANSGKVKCWGENTYGQLGNALSVDSNTPVDVVGTGGTGQLSGVSQIAVGYDHTCALVPYLYPAGIHGDKVYCWGRNDYGQLGSGSQAAFSVIPVAAIDSTNYAAAEITKIVAGYKSTCLLLSSPSTNGSVICWGKKVFGGNDYSSPYGIVTPQDFISYSFIDISISKTDDSSGYPSICAVRSDGYHTYCWGGNENGQIGTLSSPTTYPTSFMGGVASNFFKKVAVGSTHSCVITIGDHAICFGNNDYGQLGDGTTTSSTLANMTDKNDNTIADIDNIAVAPNVTCISKDDKVYCTGYNANLNIDSQYPEEVNIQ